MFCDSLFLFFFSFKIPMQNARVESSILEYFIQIDGLSEDKSETGEMPGA